MNDLKLSRRALLGASLAVAGASVLPAAHAQAPREGAEFTRIDPPQPGDDPSKIEVVEFFWYSCPHCNTFEPDLEAWLSKLPADVVAKRVPVQFNASFEPQQRLFYTLEAMGKLKEMHAKVFDAIHNRRERLTNEGRIADWAEKQGLDRAQFLAAYKSFGVSSKVQRAAKQTESYGISGVPMLAIDGKWLTSPSQTGTAERALAVADQLIEQARKARKG